ncbi:MAG: MFS transporter [Acidobacteriaceae bacterium]
MTQFNHYFGVLKNFNFTKLWVSQVCSQLTNYLLSFAVLIRTFNLTHSSLAVSVIILSFGGATVIFGSIAGVYSDRFDRRKLLTVINLLQALSVLCFLPVRDNFWGMAVVTFIYSSLNQFYLPAEAPSIPDLVKEEDLLVANSYFSFTGSGSMILGFVLAGPISLAYGSAAVFLLGFALLVLATVSTYFLPPLKRKAQAQKRLMEDFWAEFKEGILHFWDSKVLHFPLQSLFAAQIFNGMLITIVPAFVEKVLDVKLETGTFYMIAPLGLGILLGALLLGFENRYVSKPNLILAGFIGMGATMVSMAIFVGPSHPIIYAVLALVLGYFNSHIVAPSHSILQKHVSEHVRGRIYASLYVLLQTAATIPTILIGLLADKTSVYLVLGIIGGTLVATGLILRNLHSAHYQEKF